MSVRFILPTAGHIQYPVVLAGTGPHGTMCAKAEAFREFREVGPDGQVVVLRKTAEAVVAMVYPGLHDDTSPTIPPTPPASGTTPGVHEGNDVWCFPDVPCPSTAGSPGAPHTIAGWARFNVGSVSHLRGLQQFFSSAATGFHEGCICVGSGSGSNGSGNLRGMPAAAAAQRCPHCPPDQPVPVALTLTLDSPVAAGAYRDPKPLARPTRLVYAPGVGGGCRWVGEPLDLAPGSAAPACWVLEKTDPHTWILVLGHGKAELAVYRLAGRDASCAFPIRPQLVRAGKEFGGWPKSVTVAPAK